MRLKSVHVTNFRSIRDSNEFDIDDITCLVGKNEAGKTTLLTALYRLNPIVPEAGVFNLDEDYPRGEVENYRINLESGKIAPAIVVKAVFVLEHDDLIAVKKDFGENILVNEDHLVLEKGYENKLIPTLVVNKETIVGSLKAKYQLSPEGMDAIREASTLDQLIEILTPLSDTSGIIQDAQNILSAGVENYIFETYLKNRVPKFLYFDEYYQMEGSVNIQALQDRKQQNTLKDSDRPILGLIDLSRLKIDDMANPQNTELLISRLEGASNHLTGKILEYWSQNKNIEIRFDIRPGLPGDKAEFRTGYNLLGRVWNKKHKVSTPIETRSRGFIWFFSFLAWFSTQKWTSNSIILLLDEPALFLHAKAQEDMLRYIEKELKPEHQVIYTTHSPFMIDPTRFNRTRIVEDKSMESDNHLPPELEGTKVITDVLDSSSESIFPLQGALGYEIYQTLFIGPNSLIVEGVSDLLYLQTISGLLESRGMVGLDSRWTITPVGGCDKVPTFVALLGSQKHMKVATLIDIKPEDLQKIEGLYKKKLLQKNRVLTFGNFTHSQAADIEDMFDTDFYLRLVNDEYKKELLNPIVKSELSAKPFTLVSAK